MLEIDPFWLVFGFFSGVNVALLLVLLWVRS